MSDKLDNYTQIFNALVSEAISCSPQSWSEGFLTIECLDGAYLNYKLKNEESTEKAQISGELRQLCEELYVVMRKEGDWWLESTIHFFKKEESWSFQVNFKYPDKPPGNTPPTKKPWWKIWQ